jgi:hypothetical protein
MSYPYDRNETQSIPRHCLDRRLPSHWGGEQGDHSLAFLFYFMITFAPRRRSGPGLSPGSQLDPFSPQISLLIKNHNIFFSSDLCSASSVGVGHGTHYARCVRFRLMRTTDDPSRGPFRFFVPTSANCRHGSNRTGTG